MFSLKCDISRVSLQAAIDRNSFNPIIPQLQIMLGAAYNSQVYTIPQGTLQPTVPSSVKTGDDEEKLDAERRERLLAAYNKELEQTLALHPVEEAPPRKVKPSKQSMSSSSLPPRQAPRSGLDVSRHPPPNTRARGVPNHKRGVSPYKQPPLRASMSHAAHVTPQADASARPPHTHTAIGVPTHRSHPPPSSLRPEVPAAQPANKAVAVAALEGSVVSRPDTPTATASALASQLVDVPLEPLYSLAQAQANTVELGILDKVQRLEALVLVQQQQLGLHRDMVRELRQRMHTFVQRSRTAHAGRLATTTRAPNTRTRRPTAAPRPGPGFSGYGGYTRSYAAVTEGASDGQVNAGAREARLTSMIDRLYRRPAQVATGVGHGPTEEERERERELKERQERERKERISMQRARAQEDRLRERREREVRQAQEQAVRDAQREEERLLRERAKEQERQRRERVRERAKKTRAIERTAASPTAHSDRQSHRSRPRAREDGQPAAPRARPVARDAPVAAATPAAPASATAPAPAPPLPEQPAPAPAPSRASMPPPVRSFPELDDVDDSLLVPGSARVYGKRAATPAHTPAPAHTTAPASAPIAACVAAASPTPVVAAARAPTPVPATAPAIAAPAPASAETVAEAEASADYDNDFSDDFEDIDVPDAPAAQVVAAAMDSTIATPEAQLLTLSLSARHLPPRHAHTDARTDADAAVNDPLPDALLAVYALEPATEANVSLWTLPAGALLHVAEGVRGSTSPTFVDVLALTLQPGAEAGAEHVHVSVNMQRVLDHYPTAATLPLQRANVSLTPAHLLRFEVHDAALFAPAAVPSAVSLLALAVLPLHALLAHAQQPQALILTPAHAGAGPSPLLLLHPPAQRPRTQRLPTPLNAPPTRPVFDAMPTLRVPHDPAAVQLTPARDHNAAVLAVTSLPPPSLAGLSADFGDQSAHSFDSSPAVPAAASLPPPAPTSIAAGMNASVFADTVYDDFDFEDELAPTALMAADASSAHVPVSVPMLVPESVQPAGNALFAPIGVEDDYDFDFDL